MNDQNTQPSQPVAVEQKAMNRRNVLKAAIATAPFIATLPSGAALARSSSLIGASSAASAKDSKGRILCLDLKSGTGNYQNGALDLGMPPSGKLTAIKDRLYWTQPSLGAARISEADMCKQGGRFHYWYGQWQHVDVPKGILVSATALSSFAGSIFSTEV